MAQLQTQQASGTVAGYFQDQVDAERAVHALRDAGFTSAHLGVAHRGSSTSTTANAASNVTHKAGEKAEGAWEKVKSFFSGESAEPYADERTEGDLATREITSDRAASAPSSQYDDDYDHSDVHHSLTGLSVPEDRARYLGHRFGASDSGAVVTVTAPGREAEAQSILSSHGADLGDNAADYDYGDTDSSDPNSSSTTGDYSTNRPVLDSDRAAAEYDRNTPLPDQVEGTRNIQLLGEVLRVHKERVNRGEVTIRKEVITENQTIQVPVTREELVIERRAVDADTPASGSIGENNEIRIPLTEERASADTSTVVREEVAVGKKPVQEVRDLSGQVRHEELVVDDQTRKVANRD